MAGDWIKVRTDLPNDPAVIGVAVQLGLDEDTVVGKLVRLWAWANRHTRDGNVIGVTDTWIDKHIDTPGFCIALSKVGWLILDRAGDTVSIRFPKFERHNGQTSKHRALTAIRVALKRGRNGNDIDETISLPEKRREEKKNKDPPEPPSDIEIDIDQGFIEFWSAYPKKQNKVAAQKAWRKLRPAPELREQIHAGLAAQRESRQWVEGFIPHASTWLNGRRWEDEVLNGTHSASAPRPGGGVRSAARPQSDDSKFAAFADKTIVTPEAPAVRPAPDSPAAPAGDAAQPGGH